MVVANHEAPIVQPGVARVVVRHKSVLVSSIDLVYDYFERRPIKFAVSIEVIASDHNHGWVYWTEGYLSDRRLSTHYKLAEGNTALLVPVPDNGAGFRTGTRCDQEFFIFGAEVNAHKFASWVLCRAQNFSFLNRDVENGRLSLFNALFKELANVVDCADGIVALLADSKEFSAWRECHGCDSLTALDAWNEALDFLLHIIDDDVVTAGVCNRVVVEKKHVVLHVTLNTE